MSGKSANPKRARVKESAADDDEAIVDVSACPPSIHPDDFEHLKHLSAIAADRNMLSLLPMPKAAYGALGIKEPGTASLVDAALACFAKPSRERYSSTEIEIRDLRETHTAADFPEFYTGPAHPHMLPEGGSRVIVHSIEEEAKVDDDETMGTVIVPASAGGARAASSYTPAAGAGAY